MALDVTVSKVGEVPHHKEVADAAATALESFIPDLSIATTPEILGIEKAGAQAQRGLGLSDVAAQINSHVRASMPGVAPEALARAAELAMNSAAGIPDVINKKVEEHSKEVDPPTDQRSSLPQPPNEPDEWADLMAQRGRPHSGIPQHIEDAIFDLSNKILAGDPELQPA